MKKTLSRNLAAVSFIFILTFSTMFITNYFQVLGTETLQLEVIEKFKQAYEENSDDLRLQQQIRELDLLARKAYFTNQNRLKTGIVILLFMTIVFVVSLRFYFSNYRDIPGKDIDPVDEWMIKSKTRKYVLWITGGLALSGIGFALTTSPYLGKNVSDSEVSGSNVSGFEVSSFEVSDSEIPDSTVSSISPISPASPVSSDTIEISKVTHNGLRGNNSLGISPAKKVPTFWDLATGKNVLWKTEIPRKGFNSPVINGNMVFFSGADEEIRELFCYELNTGKELWRLAAKNIPGSPEKIPETMEDTGLAASSVATNGKQVCAIFATGDLICANMEGKQLWAKNLGVPDNHYGYASSLLIYGNTLFIQYDNDNSKKVFALDVTTGNPRWVKDRSEKLPSWCSPVIANVNNKPQLILIGNPGITSYNPSNGEQNWRVECMSGEPAPSPAFSNGIVFGATEYANLVAINASDGSILWKNNEFLPEIASPVATKDFVIIATTYGVVASFNSQTGEMLKYMELNVDFNSSPMIVEGKIYLISMEGKVFILSAKGEFSLINSFETGEKTFATPAFTDKKIVIRTAKSIYCVGE